MAGELERLSTHEPLASRAARHDYDRMIMLSDGVFAIAITLLALELPVPAHWDGTLVALGVALGRPLVGYVFAFLMVSAIWIAHRRLMARLVRIDMPVTILTLLQLALVGLSPLVARLIAELGPTHSFNTYLLLMGAMFTTTGATGLVAMRRGLLHPEVDPRRWTLAMGLGNVMPGLLVAALGLAGLIRGTPMQPTYFTVIVLGFAGLARAFRKRLSDRGDVARQAQMR